MAEPSHSATPAIGRQIHALLHLLSDPNERVARTIQDQLVTIGEPALPFLMQAKLDRPDLADRIADTIEEIRFSDIHLAFHDWLQNPRVDLEHGAFLLTRFAYPKLDCSGHIQQLDELAREARAKISPLQSRQEAFKRLGRFLFIEKGFQGNTKQYYDPDNSYLNRVLDRRLGIPISLAAILILVAKRIGLAVAGVGMPGHFLARLEEDPLYMDCFNGGALLSQTDCERFLRESGYTVNTRYMDNSRPPAILARMAKNLIGIYEQRQEHLLAAQLMKVVRLLENFDAGQPT